MQLAAVAAVMSAGYTPIAASFSLLWQESLGIKMAVIASVFMLVNLTVFIGGSIALNRYVSQTSTSGVMSLVLALLCFVLLYLPVLFVFLNAPAAIAMQRNLRI